MGKFDRGNRPERGRDFGRPTMHKAICSNCGKECQVPFKPTTGKPIYCSDCFEKMGGGSGRESHRPRGRNFDRPRFEDRRPQQYSPRPERPENSAEQYRSQFEALNRKLDKILKIIDTEAKVEVQIETPKPKAKKASSKKRLTLKPNIN